MSAGSQNFSLELNKVETGGDYSFNVVLYYVRLNVYVAADGNQETMFPCFMTISSDSL